MAIRRTRRRQRVDPNLQRLQASLDEAQSRYDVEVGRKRSAYEAEFAAYEQVVAQQQREYDAQLQAYNVRVSEYQAAQQANAAQRQSMLSSYQSEVNAYNTRRSDYEAEVLRMMEPYQAQLQAQQAAYANQMEDYNRAYAEYQQKLRAFDAWEKGYLRDLDARPIVFRGIQMEDGSFGISVNDRRNALYANSDAMYVSEGLQYNFARGKGAAASLTVSLNDAVQFVPTSRTYVPPSRNRGGALPAYYNVAGFLRQRLPDGTFVDQMPDAYTQTERPTFSATAPTRPIAITPPTLPEAPSAPTAPTLPLFTMQAPNAPARPDAPPAPALPDFTPEDAALQAEIARETEYYDREIAERRAGRGRARRAGGRRPLISQEQVAAAQQPNLSEGQSLGQVGFLGGT